MISIFLTFSSSILMHMSLSSLVKGRIQLEHLNFSILGGVIYITILGSLIRDPWVALVLGSGGSFLTYILLLIKEKLKPSRYVFDTKNLIPVLLINSIVASALAVPLVLLAYSDRGYEKQNDIVYEKVNHMIYTGISLGIGFGFGLLAGLLKCIIS